LNTQDVKVKKLSDYKAPDYTVDSVYLTVELSDSKTKVCSKLDIKKKTKEINAPIILDANNLSFISVKMDGKILENNEYQVTENYLKIFKGKDVCVLEIENYIDPVSNKTLEGLYKSGDMFCTQNEPEGFRRITYYIDRPDVMAKFTTKIIANKKLYPVLLSNGNLIEKGDLTKELHFAIWHDPFRKPSYLYALVAGDLGVIKGEYLTRSKRLIDLRIYCDKGNESRCHFALESLKKAMKWDEDTFGLEYDLDIFMIVAVDSFNMGAMENKGLNIFNSSLVLADAKTATDLQFQRIEGVVGHEYFHNYTGNRITCRDWFQLTLKEGLTVFRDQEFSSDMNFRGVQRIQDVEALRELQFPEDQGPTKHPIKPSSYIEINNFYTPTIYDKGSEVIRMVHTLLGKEGFRRGMDKYFELFDGQAVTTNDFIHAMSVANNNYDFSQFEQTWYHRAGTPKLEIKSSYEESEGEFHIYIRQLLESNELPFHMPYRIGLVDESGSDLEIKKDFLEIKQKENEFVFKNIKRRPYLSLNRDFSAPVISLHEYSNLDSYSLFKLDSNPFSRYEIGRKIAANLVLDYLKNHNSVIPNDYIEAWKEVLMDKRVDLATKALLISMPSESYIHQLLGVVSYQEVFDGLNKVKKTLAQTHKNELMDLYEQLKDEQQYQFIPRQVGRRDLKSEVLSYLMSLEDNNIYAKCYKDFENAKNMTDEYMTFHLLVHSNSNKRQAAIEKFYNRWSSDNLVLMKWLSAQASSPHADTLDRLNKIIVSTDYDKTVPNMIRAIHRTFGRNYIHFHHPNGLGYKFIADAIIDIDTFNPSMSSALSKLFSDFKRVPAENRVIMGNEIYRISKIPNISKNTYEIISKILS